MVKTRLLIFALLAALTSKCRSQQCPCDDALLFPGDNIQQYGISRGLSDPLSAVSACFWINTPASYQDNHAPTQISYATQQNDNQFLIWIERGILKLSLSRAYFKAPFDVTIADGTNHHVCVTWVPSAGKIQIYVDGKKRIEEKGDEYVKTDIPTGGTWIIGQDQDTLEGGFTKTDSMKGMLAGVNIWDRILCPYEIVALASSCGPIIKGNIKSHNDFAIKGGLNTFKLACCLSSC